MLAENQECHERRVAACCSDEELVLENTSYARVLSLFRISSLFPFKRFVEEQRRQLKWSVAACVGVGTVKNLLATGPIALPPSIIDIRWGGSRAVHFLNDAAADTSPASPSRPTDEFDFDIDDCSRSKLASSGVNSSGLKRNSVIESDASSPELAAAPEMPLSATQDTRRHKTLDVVSTAEVDSAAAEAIAAAVASAGEVDTAKPSAFKSARRGSQQQQQQQQQQQPTQNAWRHSAVGNSEVVLLDD